MTPRPVELWKFRVSAYCPLPAGKKRKHQHVNHNIRRKLRVRQREKKNHLPAWKTVHLNSSWPVSAGWIFPRPYIWHNRTGWPIVRPGPWSRQPAGFQRNIISLLFDIIVISYLGIWQFKKIKVFSYTPSSFLFFKIDISFCPQATTMADD